MVQCCTLWFISPSFSGIMQHTWTLPNGAWMCRNFILWYTTLPICILPITCDTLINVSMVQTRWGMVMLQKWTRGRCHLQGRDLLPLLRYSISIQCLTIYFVSSLSRLLRYCWCYDSSTGRLDRACSSIEVWKQWYENGGGGIRVTFRVFRCMLVTKDSRAWGQINGHLFNG